MLQVAVDQRFYAELNALIPDQASAVVFLDSAKLYLTHNPDSGEEAYRRVRTKIVPDTPRSRDLVIYYMVEGQTITFKSIKEMPWHLPEELAGCV